MLIISKFKDYYDGVVGTTGVDKTIVYKRIMEAFDSNENLPKEFQYKMNSFWKDTKSNKRIYGLNSFHIEDNKKYDDFDYFIIGFCGNLYVGIRFYKDEKLVDIVYDYNEYSKYLKEHKYFPIKLTDAINNIENYDVINVFREYNTPIFAFDVRTPKWNSRYEKFTVNPILKDYKFYKKFDTFSTFQEIQMFISGVLGSNENNTIEIDDKYKIAQHGFNNWSFRREPQKK